jgi:hypothetical protein
MRFFDTNYLFKDFGGTITASSNSQIAYMAFDEKTKFRWRTSSENTDGDSVYLEQELISPATINRIFVAETNISNLTIEVDLGAGYVTLPSNTLTKSNDNYSYYYELESSQTIEKIKFIGSNTIIANEEKYITNALAFQEIGQIKYNDAVKPTIERIQVINKLNNGRSDIINKGRQISFKIKFKSHYSTADNEIIRQILNRDAEFWLWLNDDQEDLIYMPQEPYRFKDIYKVAFKGNHSMTFNDNIWFSGIDTDFSLIQVA